MTESDTQLPLLEGVLTGMAAMCAISLTAMEAYQRLMTLESDDCPQPDYEDPNVVAARASGGELVFVKDADGYEGQSIIVEDDDLVVELEEAR